MESTDLVLNRMGEYVRQWKSCDDPRETFLSCYQMMSLNMRAAINAGEFHDSIWVNKLLNRFADYYFESLSCYDCGQKASKVWEHTHKTTQSAQLSQIQYLILGVNAHINYDLVLALFDMLQPEWKQLSNQQKQIRLEDHNYVNQVIARTIDRVQDELLEPSNPGLAWVDKLFGRVDEFLISKLITNWRTDVWDNTQRFLEATSSEEKEQIRAKLEQEVLDRADVICFF